ncbi:hypothetical protein BDY24DRAFT_400497 [Mrakia frigida]|uniref:uncharacterized protein n=1 Tax=Mrakia frigida TaxID=29902 RepID=UPI003FCC0C13
MATVFQTNTTQFGFFDSQGYVFGSTGPCLPSWTLLHSTVWILQVMLSDAPFVAIGLLGFALVTFFVVAGKLQRSICYIIAAILSAFFASVFDLAQILIGNSGNRKVTALIIAQQFFLGWSLTARFLFFFRFTGEAPPGEVPIPSTGSETRALGRTGKLHSAVWERFGVVGLVSKWVLLLAVINIGVLNTTWRVGFLFSIAKFRSIYYADQIAQVIVSTGFLVKIVLNIFESSRTGRSKWVMAGLYSAPLAALVTGTAVSAGGVALLLFSETPVGRFLQAMEMYIISVFMLVIFHRYHGGASSSFVSLDASNDSSSIASRSDRNRKARSSFIGLGTSPTMSTFRLSPPNVSSPNSEEVHVAARNLKRPSYLDGRMYSEQSRMSKAKSRASETFTNWLQYMRKPEEVNSGSSFGDSKRMPAGEDRDRLWEKGSSAAYGEAGPSRSRAAVEEEPASAALTSAGVMGGGVGWVKNRDVESGMGAGLVSFDTDQTEEDLRSANPIIDYSLPPLGRTASPFLVPSEPPRAVLPPPQRPDRPSSLLPYETNAQRHPATPGSPARSFNSAVGIVYDHPSPDIDTSSNSLGTISSRASPENDKSRRPISSFNRQSSRSTAQSSSNSDFSIGNYVSDFPVPPRARTSYQRQEVGVAIGGEDIVEAAEEVDDDFDLLPPPTMPAARAERISTASETSSLGVRTSGSESRNAMDAEFDVTSFIAGERDTLQAHPFNFPVAGEFDDSASILSLPATPQAEIMQAQFLTRRPSQSRQISRRTSRTASSFYPPNTALTTETITPADSRAPSPRGLPSNPRPVVSPAPPSSAPSSPVSTVDDLSPSNPTSAATTAFSLPPTTLYRNPARPIHIGTEDISPPFKAGRIAVPGGVKAVFERPRPAPIATGKTKAK